MKLILFFLFISSSEQFKCLTTNFEKFQFSTSPLNQRNIENIINREIPFNENITWCQVQLIMNYDKQILEIISNPFYSSGFPNFSVVPTAMVTFTLNNDQASTIIEQEYACRSSFCDREFIRRHYLWIVDNNFTDMEENLSKLLVKENNSPLICINNFMREHTEMCNNTACTAQYSISLWEDLSQQRPSRGYAGNNQNLTILRITTTFFEKMNEITQNIYYTCTYNECNNNSTTNAIHNLIQTSFSLSCILYGSCFQIDEDDRSTTVTTNIVSSLDKITSDSFINKMTTRISNTAGQNYCHFSDFIQTLFMFSLLFCF